MGEWPAMIPICPRRAESDAEVIRGCFIAWPVGYFGLRYLGRGFYFFSRAVKRDLFLPQPVPL